MPTTALTITPAWTKAADGPASVLIPAIQRFSFCVDSTTPSLSPSVCPSREAGTELSCELVAGESLYVAAPLQFNSSVTTGA